MPARLVQIAGAQGDTYETYAYQLSHMHAELPPREPLPTGPYPPEVRGKLIKTVPVNEGHSIRIKWIIPALEPLWKESPDSFLSHLIGHEGKGSLFAELKAQGWARSLSAGGGRLLRGEGSFVVAVSLTDEGALHSMFTVTLLGLVQILDACSCSQYLLDIKPSTHDCFTVLKPQE